MRCRQENCQQNHIPVSSLHYTYNIFPKYSKEIKLQMEIYRNAYEIHILTKPFITISSSSSAGLTNASHSTHDYKN